MFYEITALKVFFSCLWFLACCLVLFLITSCPVSSGVLGHGGMGNLVVTGDLHSHRVLGVVDVFLFSFEFRSRLQEV